MVKRTANQISTSTESALPDPNLKKGRGTETTWGQKAAIMEWLELPRSPDQSTRAPFCAPFGANLMKYSTYLLIWSLLVILIQGIQFLNPMEFEDSYSSFRTVLLSRLFDAASLTLRELWI